jgi:hypothetical protein
MIRQRYENNYNVLNLITISLGRNVYDRVSHLETAHDVCLKLCNTYVGSSEIKSSCKDTYNRHYQIFAQKPGESLDDCFARFESIVSSLSSCDPLAYSDNERAKQLLYSLDDHVWGMKITALEESADFTTLDIEKSKWFYDTSTRAATGAARCGSFVGKAFSHFGCSLWMNMVDTMICEVRAA